MDSFHVSASLLTLLCCALGSLATLDYSALDMLGFANCPHKNHCQQIGNASFLDRVCECDRACNRYGDCCLNAPWRTSGPVPKTAVCMPYGNLANQGAYAVAKCPADYSGPREIRRQCRSGNASDPFLTTPVTDPRTGRTYLNRYCALCNDANSNNLQTWTIAVSCDNSNSGDFELRDLTYNSDRWGLYREGRFDECHFSFDKPAYVRNVRFCRAGLVSTCPSNYTRSNFLRACESYMSVVQGRDVLYRNPHCAVCNNVTVNDMECYSAGLGGRKTNKPFSFALLLDVNRSDGDIVGESTTNMCPARQKYDPFFKKCRPLVCAIPGFKMRNGKCVKG